MFVVMGDSYAGSWGNYAPGGIKGTQRPQTEGGKRWERKAYDDTTWRPPTSHYPQGNLMMVPHRLALTLQADGWIVRNDVVYAKKACMPESVAGWRWEKHRIKVKLRDRSRDLKIGVLGQTPVGSVGSLGEAAAQWQDCPGCPKCEANSGLILKRGSWRHTRAHEFVLMCTKKMGYFADQEKVREPHARDYSKEGWANVRGQQGMKENSAVFRHGGTKTWAECMSLSGRNPRSVLTPKPEPFLGSHFAVYPTSLITNLIKATCPDKCCPECGKGWAPMIEKTAGTSKECLKTQASHLARGGSGVLSGTVGKSGGGRTDGQVRVLDYRPTCKCGCEDSIPGTCLDSFSGSGTTGLVCERLGLNSVLIEISLDYAEMARDRIIGEAPLLNRVEIE